MVLAYVVDTFFLLYLDSFSSYPTTALKPFSANVVYASSRVVNDTDQPHCSLHKRTCNMSLQSPLDWNILK